MGVLASVEAETFDLCRLALRLSGEYVDGADGFFYHNGQRVILRWVDPNDRYQTKGLLS